MLLKFLRKYSFFSTVLGTLFFIVILAVTRFDILPFLKNNMGSFGNLIFDYISTNNLEYVINSSTMIAISNFLVYILSSCTSFELSVKNSNFKSDFTELPLASSKSQRHVQKKFYFHIKADYKNTISYFLYRLIGGISLEITYPSWIDATVDETFWNTGQYVTNDTKQIILINLFDSFDKEKLKNFSGEIYCCFEFITNLDLTGFDESFIGASLKPQSKNFIQRIFASIFIWLFYDLSYDRHNIKTSN